MSTTPSTDMGCTYLQMIKKSTGSSNDEVDALDQLIGLCLTVRTTHEDTKCLRMVLHELLGNTEDLEGEFSRRRDDNDTSSFNGD